MRIEVEVRVGDRDPLRFVHEEWVEWTSLHALNLAHLVQRATCPHTELRQVEETGVEFCAACAQLTRFPEGGQG